MAEIRPAVLFGKLNTIAYKALGSMAASGSTMGSAGACMAPSRNRYCQAPYASGSSRSAPLSKTRLLHFIPQPLGQVDELGGARRFEPKP